MRNQPTKKEKEILSLMEGYLDHDSIVRKIAEETGNSPDDINKVVRAVFGYHGITKRVVREFKKVSVPGLGEFRVVFSYKNNVVRKRKRALKRKNREAFKRFYYKNR